MEPEQSPMVTQPAHVLENQQLGQPLLASGWLTKGGQEPRGHGLLPPKPCHPGAHISTALCKATSCVTFTFAFSGALAAVFQP